MAKADDESLELLLVATGHQDRQAFERLYRLVASKLFALCTQMLRKDLAEDAVQETFVQIWRNAAKFDRRRAAPMTWMAAIARNRAIDILRQGTRNIAESAGDEDFNDFAAANAGPLEQVLNWSDATSVRTCLEELTQIQREVILLAFFRGFTHAELGRILAVPLGTIKSRIREGLERLKRCLQP